MVLAGLGAVLISRSQPKILRKIQKKLRRYISGISRFLHLCLISGVSRLEHFEKTNEENNLESESGGQMALTFTRRKRDKNVFLPDNIKCCTSFCLSQHNLNPIQYKSIRDSARFIYCHSFNFLSSQYPSWKISVLFLYLFLVYPDSVFSSPN